MKIVILRSAQAELDEATDYYTDHASPRIAQAFLDDFFHARCRLAERPEIGPPVSKRFRTLRLRRFPYSIIYELAAETIIVHALGHQSRRPGYWRGKR